MALALSPILHFPTIHTTILVLATPRCRVTIQYSYSTLQLQLQLQYGTVHLQYSTVRYSTVTDKDAVQLRYSVHMVYVARIL